MWGMPKIKNIHCGQACDSTAAIFTITTDRNTVTQQYPDIAVIVPTQVLPGPLRRAAGRPKDEP
jgi:hypothetical protein